MQKQRTEKNTMTKVTEKTKEMITKVGDEKPRGKFVIKNLQIKPFLSFSNNTNKSSEKKKTNLGKDKHKKINVWQKFNKKTKEPKDNCTKDEEKDNWEMQAKKRLRKNETEF